MNKLENKITVITGGNSGIGLATAKLFKQEGAKVIVNARNETRLNETLKTDALHFDKILKADVTRIADIENLYKQVEDEFGKIDVLFLNAGIGQMIPLEILDEKLFDELVDTNFKGVFFGIQKALPHMNDGASIIVTTSVTNQMSDPLMTAYAGTKAAVASLIKTVAMSVNKRNIRVNALSPGPVETPIFSKVGIPTDQLDDMKEMLNGMIPLGRMGSVEELAKAVLFLASNDSTFMTGSEMVVDGGFSLK